MVSWDEHVLHGRIPCWSVRSTFGGFLTPFSDASSLDVTSSTSPTCFPPLIFPETVSPSLITVPSLSLSCDVMSIQCQYLTKWLAQVQYCRSQQYQIDVILSLTAPPHDLTFNATLAKTIPLNTPTSEPKCR